MKKLLLTLGTMTSIVAPVAAVVSCGSEKTTTKAKEVVTTPVVIQTPASTEAASTTDTTNTENTQTTTVENQYYSEYNMRSIAEMEHRNELSQLLFMRPKSAAAFKRSVGRKAFTDDEKTMLNNIIDHYTDKDGNALAAWYMLKFAYATTEEANIAIAVMGWKHNGVNATELEEGSEELEAAKQGVKEYILNGTIDIHEVAHSIIEKFLGHDAHFNMDMVGSSFTLDESKKTFTKSAMAAMAMPAMGGEEVMNYILQNGEGWSIVDAPAA